MHVSSSTVPADAAFTIETIMAIEVASTIEVSPTIEVPPTIEIAGSPVLSHPSNEAQIPEDPSQGEKGVEKKRVKGAVRKSRRKVRNDRPNNSNEELGENPFHNHEIVRGLVNGFTIPEVVN